MITILKSDETADYISITMLISNVPLLILLHLLMLNKTQQITENRSVNSIKETSQKLRAKKQALKMFVLRLIRKHLKIKQTLCLTIF